MQSPTKKCGLAPLPMVALLTLVSAVAADAATRTIEFVASDFRTEQDNPSDFRSIGDPFGIFGLSQPAEVRGSIVFDTDAEPLFGPATSDVGDPEFENSRVHAPYVDFAVVLGPGVVLRGAHVNFGDAVVVGDGVGTKTTDNLWFISWSDQTMPSGISFDMQIQLVGERTFISGLAVPVVDVYNSMAEAMPSHDEKLRIDMFDAQGNPHKLVAFTIRFLEVQTVAIDIKPGSDPNCFNVDGHGVVPVAILGADDFDATQIDPSSLSFAGLDLRVRGDKGPSCSVGYSDSDAYLDLICQFEDDPDAWKPGDGEAALTGVLYDGTRIRGSDSICVVP